MTAQVIPDNAKKSRPVINWDWFPCDVEADSKDVLSDYSIKALYLFGSVVRGEDNPGSDVDILVEFEPEIRMGLFGLVRLQRRLSEVLGSPVDLVTPDALHKAMKERILKEAVRAA